MIDDRVAGQHVVAVQAAFLRIGGGAVRAGGHQHDDVLRQQALGFEGAKQRAQDAGFAGVGNVGACLVGNDHDGGAPFGGFVRAGVADDVGQRRGADGRGEGLGDGAGRVGQRRGRLRHGENVRACRHLKRRRRGIDLQTTRAGHTVSPLEPGKHPAPGATQRRYQGARCTHETHFCQGGSAPAG